MDRAAIVATAVVQIVVNALHGRRGGGSAAALATARAAVAAQLRDEFAEVARQARADMQID